MIQRSTSSGDPGIRAVLFDIDGTLLTTGGAGAAAWSEAFDQLYGTPVDIEAVTESGMPDSDVLLTAFASAVKRKPEPAEIGRLTERYLENLPAAVANSRHYRLSPGITHLLERLSDAGLLLGLITGNIEPAARIKLDRGDLNRFFTFGGFGSDSNLRSGITRKALDRGIEQSGGVLSARDFVSIGDTPRDVEAGHATGIRVIGVATGHFPVEQLEAAGADWVLENVEHGFPV